MRVVYVVDTVQSGNGVAASVKRSATALRERGHEVRVASTDGTPWRPHLGWLADAAPRPQDRFEVRPWVIPVVEAFAAPQHFTFAKPDRTALENALEGADVVHVWLATPFGRMAVDLAHERGIPVTAGFHVQPENITYNIGLARHSPTIDWIYRKLDDYVYSRVEHVHAPSRFIADQLAEHGYRATTHVISNGVIPAFHPLPRRDPWTPGCGRPFRVMTVGRMSAEKRQHLLIDALRHSRHRDEIEVQIAGRGPLQALLKLQSLPFGGKVRLAFHDQAALISQLQHADLYVHPADIEIEAVACLEAVACGLVPVISDSDRSAAGQFALDERSLFRARDARHLAERIDWWLEHPAERAEMEPRYAASAQGYGIDRSVDLLEGMFRQAMGER